ncbi:MAG: J domain-containing protein [Deltaproteobacteria bacterium]|jgi:hypothetical protein|nr:J domain-containing protein [Deltaproteobacteria bacterium]
MFIDLYEILGLKTDATYPEIREAYVRLVLRYPPELFPNKFQRLKYSLDNLALTAELTGNLHDLFEKYGDAEEIFCSLFADRLIRPKDHGDLKSLIGEAKVPKTQSEVWEYLTCALNPQDAYLDPIKILEAQEDEHEPLDGPGFRVDDDGIALDKSVMEQFLNFIKNHQDKL